MLFHMVFFPAIWKLFLTTQSHIFSKNTILELKKTNAIINEKLTINLTGISLDAIITAWKMKFSIKDFFNNCDQIRRSRLLKKPLMENFIFCAVIIEDFTSWYSKNTYNNKNNFEFKQPHL